MVPADTGWTEALPHRDKRESWQLFCSLLGIASLSLTSFPLEANAPINLPSHHLIPSSSSSVGHSSILLIDWTSDCFYAPAFPQLSSMVLLSILITCHILTFPHFFLLYISLYPYSKYCRPGLTSINVPCCLGIPEMPNLQETKDTLFSGAHVLFYCIPPGHVHLNAIGFAMLEKSPLYQIRTAVYNCNSCCLHHQ